MKTNRILETVKGYDAAVKTIKFFATSWNESNETDSMVVSKSGLYARDNEGSGEFFEAHCININDVASISDEIYEIQTCW